MSFIFNAPVPHFDAPVPQCHDKAYAYNSALERFWPGQLVTVPFLYRAINRSIYYALILRIYPDKPGDPYSPLKTELLLVDARKAEDRQKSFGVTWFAPLSDLTPVRDAEDLARYYLALGNIWGTRHAQ